MLMAFCRGWSRLRFDVLTALIPGCPVKMPTCLPWLWRADCLPNREAFLSPHAPF